MWVLGISMRCYFMRDGHIESVEFLTAADDRIRIEEARHVFNINCSKFEADGFEVWDGVAVNVQQNLSSPRQNKNKAGNADGWNAN